MVLATQNPVETEGTYPLPEAQLDRFLFKVEIGYPSKVEEAAIVSRTTGPPGHAGDELPLADVKPRLPMVPAWRCYNGLRPISVWTIR